MNNNLKIKEILKVFEGSLPPGRAMDQPCRYSDAFIYIFDGEGEYAFPGKKTMVRKKTLMYFPKGSAYKINIISTIKYICIDFNFEQETLLRDGIIWGNKAPELGNEFSKLLKIYLMKSPWYEPALFSGVYRIYSEFIKLSNSGYAKISPIFSDITTYILENLKNPDFSVSALSSHFGVSEVHLRRIFKAATGVSPIRYINYLRLEKAKTLLMESSLPVLEISEAVGFSDSFYFSRLFKKETGESPVSFRKNNPSVIL